MRTFKNFYLLKESMLPTTYNSKFLSLPWNWSAMQTYKILQPIYYYAKENYVNGQEEKLHDNEFSLISLPNLHGIPQNELSSINKISGHKPTFKEFIRSVMTPRMIHDDKINQIYDGIKMIGKNPEYFDGKDIRITQQI